MSIPLPILEINDRIEVEWPMSDESFDLFSCKVTNIIRCKHRRRRSRFKYILHFDDGDKKTTRLKHLKWRRLLPCARSNSFTEYKLDLKNDCRYVLAPMVGASELAFRLLCRKYGARLAYTPMMNSELFANDSAYREMEFQTVPSDRPLVAHFSGNDPQTMLAAAKFVESKCDAIDLNLGCPQRIAHAGHFGSYLLDDNDRDLVINIIKTLSENISIPIFVKIRLLDKLSDTITLCQQLVTAGASLIAVHARYRVNLVGRTGAGARDGPAMLDQVTEIKKAIPSAYIISNGNVRCWEDVLNNLRDTGADGVMSAEGLLDTPTLFSPSLSLEDTQSTSISTASESISNHVSHSFNSLSIALEYLDLVELYPVKLKSVVFHIRRMCREPLTRYQLLEECLTATSTTKIKDIILQARSYQENNNFIFDEMKERRVKEASQRKTYEEGKRKRFEERMIRKAKREKKDLNFYLNQGTETPTVEELEILRDMSLQDAFIRWKEKHSQHCFAYHFEKNGCSRDRLCSFLHLDASNEPLAYG